MSEYNEKLFDKANKVVENFKEKYGDSYIQNTSIIEDELIYYALDDNYKIVENNLENLKEDFENEFIAEDDNFRIYVTVDLDGGDIYLPAKFIKIEEV